MSNTENFRVEDKGNVHMNGKKTTFKLFRRDGASFVYVGQFAAPGWNASDASCIAAALEKLKPN